MESYSSGQKRRIGGAQSTCRPLSHLGSYFSASGIGPLQRPTKLIVSRSSSACTLRVPRQPSRIKCAHATFFRPRRVVPMMKLTWYCLLPSSPNFRDKPLLPGDFEEESHGDANTVGSCPPVPVASSSINHHPKTCVHIPCPISPTERVDDVFGSLGSNDFRAITQYSTVPSVQLLANDQPSALLGVVPESSISVERYYLN